MRRRVSTVQLGLVLGAMGLLTGAGHARAATTDVLVSTREPGHLQIFNDMFGGTFTSDGVNFTNGDITAQRVDDDDDQLDASGQYNVQTRGKFAGLDQKFGYLAGDTGGTFNELFSVDGRGFDASGSTTLDIPSPTFRWARQGINGTFTTRNADNAGGRDHVVTYRILGQAVAAPTKVLFFEDLAGSGSDLDFNDLVVQVTRLEPGTSPPAAVPSPAAVWPGLALLLGLTGLRRRRQTTEHS